MIARLVAIAACLLLPFAAQAQTPKTKAQLQSEITSLLPNNTTGAITPLLLRNVLSDIVNGSPTSLLPSGKIYFGNSSGVAATFVPAAGFASFDSSGNISSVPTIGLLSALGGLPIAGGTMTGPLILSGNPTATFQAAPKGYVDALAAGLAPKVSVVAATTTNGALASAYENGDTIDTVTLATGNRILIKDQSAQAENGIYTVNASGAPTRSTDLDTWAEAIGAATFVTGGSANIAKGFVAIVTTSGTIDVTAMPWTQNSSSTTYTAGSGLTLTTGVFAADSGTSGHKIPFLDGVNNTWSGINIFSGMSNPQILFSPSSGATKVGSLSQNTDVLQIGASGVAIYGAFDLNTGTFSLTPTATSLAKGINITQTGPTSGTIGTNYSYNSITVSEAVFQTNSGSNAAGLWSTFNIGGANSAGQKNGIIGTANLNSPTSATPNIQRDYIGGGFYASAFSPDNGTNTGNGALGNMYAINPVATAFNGATNLAQVAGGETDVQVQAGASSRAIYGMSYVRAGTEQAAVHDAAINIISTNRPLNTAQWGNAILIESETGLLGIKDAVISFDGVNSGTIQTGIDLSAGGKITITGNAWISPGAVIDGAGNAIFTHYWVAGVGNGVDCSSGGTPLNLSTAVVSSGIITHC